MENNLNIENIPENHFVKKIEEIKAKYEGASMFPMGEISNVSYSDLGETLSLELSGDVPTNFNSPNIVMVHPDSKHEGWIGKGKIGFTLTGEGVPISKIPLPAEAINLIKEIYQEYTGEEYREYMQRATLEGQQDATPFAVPGLYNKIVDAKD